MVSTWTRTRLDKQGYNENSTTWGIRLNNNFDKIDDMVNGWSTKDLSNQAGIYVLTSNDGATDEQSLRGIRFTGSLAANLTIRIPSVTSYHCYWNDTTGGFNLLVGPQGGTPITIKPGQRMLFLCDGSQCIDVMNAIAGDLKVEGTLIANGGFSIGGSGVLGISNGGTGANSAIGSTMPPGTICAFGYAGTIAGWLDCDGSAVSRTTYATLFGLIGTTWGAGDTTSTFNVPDFRGRALIGDGTGSGLTARVIGQSSGTETHTMTASELVAHTHTGTTAGHSTDHVHTGTTDAGGAHTHTLTQINGVTNVSGSLGSGNAFSVSNQLSTDSGGSHQHTFTTGGSNTDHTHSFTTASTGSTQPFSIMQPYAVVRFKIKT